MRTRFIALMCIAAAACHDDPVSIQQQPGHPMVGTYDLQATYTTLTIPGPQTSAVNASLAGTIVIADSLYFNATDSTYGFQDVRLSTSFCSSPGSCGATVTSWETMQASLRSQGQVDMVFGRGPRTEFRGNFANGKITGTTIYSPGTEIRDQYSGTFVATKR